MTEDSISISDIAFNSSEARERIGTEIFETPLIPSLKRGSKLLFKAENFQNTGSFKIRGALSKLTALAKEIIITITKMFLLMCNINYVQ